ncbi:carbohydrate ABC transporter permease [Myceligenerans pegani]|uniref:Sugar ABC transporter permease n=1 Tax=Myceligenerans pegani TaxID=2776917 RepID=A0ABR9N5U2_9MICO|nr:sugar ABC transporter permease [Myceligenerans sp. TRM 65318]MBE1879031.1 sugar ABC transporter permease [Myceligenerans sp. TRM 65318]MBE3021302.1 sugar ABC transporter permease [Myceligenerans sp. TRM 65318]
MTETTRPRGTHHADHPASGPPTGSSPRVRRRPRWRAVQAFKGAALTFPFLAGFGLFVLVPVVMALKESVFATKSAGGLGFGEQTVAFVGLDNFVEGLGDQVFWAGMLRVFLYALVVVPSTQLLSLACALLLDAARRRTAARLRVVLLLPYMVPGVVATMVWLFQYSPVVGPLSAFFRLFGLDLNFYSGELVWFSIGNMALWGALGFNMLILYGALQSVPHEIFEAARLDGAGELRIALAIKVPFVRSSLVLTSLLSIIGTLQLFDQTLLFRAVTPETITKDFTPAMMIYNQAFQVGNLNYATALSVILAAVVGVASAFVYRFTNREEA